VLPISNIKCCSIAAVFSQFPVEFADLTEELLQVCQYSANIAELPEAQSKWLHARGTPMLAAAL
jgi:hypothetical protein